MGTIPLLLQCIVYLLTDCMISSDEVFNRHRYLPQFVALVTESAIQQAHKAAVPKSSQADMYITSIHINSVG